MNREMVAKKERLLAYASGIMGSRLSNPNHTAGVTDWLIKDSIKKAHKLIELIYSDEALEKILNEDVV